jgi:diacylglycerol O-acyltransferase / wax synthase
VALTRLRIDELLYTWVADRNTPSQMALLGVLDATPFLRPEGTVDVGRIRAELATRAARVGPLRQRVVWTRTGEGRPAWVPDPAFAPLEHVEAVTLPIGADLGNWAANRAVRPLDRDRPLWRAEVVDGLSDRRFAVLIVVSHVLADGLAGVALAGSLLDPRPDVIVTASPAPIPPPLPSHGDLVRERLRDVGTALRRVRRPAVGSHPGLRRSVRQFHEAMSDFAGREPATSLPRRIGPGRRLGTVRQPLETLQQTGHALGVTVNDLLLAAVTGGLRQLLTAGNQNAPGLQLRATVPAATGRTDRQVMSMLVLALPVGEPDPMRRLALIHTATTAGKARLRAAGADLGDLRLPTPAARWLVRTVRNYGSRHVTLSVTDVPGPPTPLWLAGARLLAAVPIAPLGSLVPLSVAALSYAGELTVSVNADAAVTDLDCLVEGTTRAFAELAELSGSRARSST